jgi:hypothetical protein
LTTFFALAFLFSAVRSFTSRQVGGDGCGVPMMSPTFIRMLEFDTEHTRFASKYNLFLYREEGVDPYTQDNIGVSLKAFVLLVLRGTRSDGNVSLTVFLRSLVERCPRTISPWKCWQLPAGPVSSSGGLAALLRCGSTRRRATRRWNT